MVSKNLLLISDDPTLIEIFQQLEGFELTISPHSWYVEARTNHYDAAIIDADFARMTENINFAISQSSVAFAIISPQGLTEFLNENRTKFYDIWVQPIYSELLYERIRKALEHKVLIQPFSTGMSFFANEIANPLYSTKGYLEVLLSGLTGELTEQQKQFIVQIKGHTERINSTISRFRDVTGLEAGIFMARAKPTNFHEALKRFAQEITDVELSIPINLPLIMSDGRAINGFFEGLTRIIQLCPSDNRKISVSASSLNQEIAVTIVVYGFDTLAPMLRQKISEFLPQLISESFTNTKLGGIWVGLSAISHYLYQVGSDVFFESELGKGSTIYFTLPIAKDESSNPS